MKILEEFVNSLCFAFITTDNKHNNVLLLFDCNKRGECPTTGQPVGQAVGQRDRQTQRLCLS